MHKKNKNDLELIRSIIEKAKPVKTDTGYVCNGLTQRSKSSSLHVRIKKLTKRFTKLRKTLS